jgi:hypothetical protein
MRKTILFVVVAVLAVMVLPGLGIGQPTSSHGGTPSDVFMSTDPACATPGMRQREALSTPVAVSEESHVIVSFSAEWALDPGVEGLLTFDLGNADTGWFTDFEWGVPGSRMHTTQSVTWTFADVPAGDYNAIAYARVDPMPLGPGGGRASAVLDSCALTVFVIPAA